MLSRLFLLVCIAFSSFALASTPIDSLPFPVKIGGEEAKAENPDSLAAVLKKTIPAAAELEVQVERIPPILIVNAFRSDATGAVKDQNSPIIIVGQNTKKLKLDATIDHKKLEPGFYLLTIVAEENTARVLVEIQ